MLPPKLTDANTAINVTLLMTWHWKTNESTTDDSYRIHVYITLSYGQGDYNI